MILIARVLMAAIFIVAGIRKAMAFPIVAGMMAGKGFPLPEAFLAASIVLDLAGGALLILNVQPRWVGWALAGYTVLVAVIFHGFWTVWSGAPPAFANELNHFLKNLAIAGGLILVAEGQHAGRSGS